MNYVHHEINSPTVSVYICYSHVVLKHPFIVILPNQIANLLAYLSVVINYTEE